MIRKLLQTIDQRYTAPYQEGNQKIGWGLIIALCFGIIFFLNIITPRIADDFVYLYIFGEREQVASLGDIVRSQITHYQMWGGRSVVHFIAQGLLQMPLIVADLLNSLVYLLFVGLIYLHIKGKSKQNSLAVFVLVNLAVWFVIPMFGDTILWTTGSANYLWGTTIILAFLLPYRLYEGQGRSTLQKVVVALGLLLFGIVAGWTNENSAAGMIVIVLLFFLLYKHQGWKIPTEYVVPLIGVCAGYVMMIKAPGNFNRGGEAVTTDLFVICYRVFAHTRSLFLDYGFFIILYAVLFVLFDRFSLAEKKTTVLTSVIYLLGGVVAIYVMVLSPQFPARAWFGIVTFFIIGTGIVLLRLNYKEAFILKMRDALVIVASLCFAFSFYLATKDIYRMYGIDKERESLAKEAREAGADKCYFRMFSPQTTYVHGEDSQTHFQLSYYYGIYIEFEKE